MSTDFRKITLSDEGKAGIISVLKEKRRCLNSEELQATFVGKLSGMFSVPWDTISGQSFWTDLLHIHQVSVLIDERKSLLCKVADFDVNSVYHDLVWRKNVFPTQDRQCWPGRYGWFSDDTSIKSLLASYRDTGTAYRFLDEMGFDEPYGNMYFLFFTKNLLGKLRDTQTDDKEAEEQLVEFFAPLWPKMLEVARHFVLSAPIGTDVLGGFSKQNWQDAINYYEKFVIGSDPNDPEMIQNVLHYAAKNKMKVEKGKAPSPIYEPFHAVRHLLDLQFGANELFSGDGSTYSRNLVRGQREYLGSSFRNFLHPRVQVTDPS